MPAGDIRIQREDDLAFLLIDRPRRRNALDGAMWAELGDLAGSLAADPPRAVIVVGSGEHFSAGMDLSMDNPLLARLAAPVMARDDEALRGIIRELRSGVDALGAIPCPVIAAIEGGCLGGGLEIALACDMRLSASNAFFSLPETLHGMVPDLGGTTRLARLVGRARASELILSADRIEADTALSWGLVNRLVAPGTALEAARALAGRIARCSPAATRETLLTLREGEALPLDEAFARETRAGAAALCSGEVMEGLAAFVERRPARWGGAA